MYYEAPPEKRPSGCLDVLVVTRAVFGVLFWPLAALGVVAVLFVAAFVLFAVHPALALIPVVVAVLGLVLFARWERRRFRPPGL